MSHTTDSDVLELIDDQVTIDDIADRTGWKHGEIVILAKANGLALNVSSKRFQRVAAPKPKPQGVVRAVEANASERTAPRGLSAPATSQTTSGTLAPAHRDLIAEGKASSLKSVQAAAQRAADALDRLAALLTETREREAALAEVRALEKRLAAAKEKLKPKGTQHGNGNPDAAVIRAWAAENGVECTRTGIIPKAVRQAYEAAPGGAA